MSDDADRALAQAFRDAAAALAAAATAAAMAGLETIIEFEWIETSNLSTKSGRFESTCRARRVTAVTDL